MPDSLFKSLSLLFPFLYSHLLSVSSPQELTIKENTKVRRICLAFSPSLMKNSLGRLSGPGQLRRFGFMHSSVELIKAKVTIKKKFIIIVQVVADKEVQPYLY
ncbi:hypothetical protein CDAR_552501 [Caerostris darwini]|uniref:Uncharacterized protein n=1 Tax=Caerostris darwini TaxID=1538125 RepID=A0AAV4STD8_9ARAC|nr:hypothetical protein CDAR_552501 [Caerostris darwini]